MHPLITQAVDAERRSDMQEQATRWRLAREIPAPRALTRAMFTVPWPRRARASQSQRYGVPAPRLGGAHK